MVITIILIIILSFLEATFVPLNLVVLVVIYLSAVLPIKKALIFSFAGGLILDLIKGSRLGQSSIFFLSISLVIFLYQNRFQAKHLRFLLPLTFLAILAANLLKGMEFNFLGIFINTIMVIIVIKVVKIIFPIEKKLSLD